jgi:hypothetical protein
MEVGLRMSEKEAISPSKRNELLAKHSSWWRWFYRVLWAVLGGSLLLFGVLLLAGSRVHVPTGAIPQVFLDQTKLVLCEYTGDHDGHNPGNGLDASSGEFSKERHSLDVSRIGSRIYGNEITYVSYRRLKEIDRWDNSLVVTGYAENVPCVVDKDWFEEQVVPLQGERLLAFARIHAPNYARRLQDPRWRIPKDTGWFGFVKRWF